jgi:hypothetical protein
VERHVFAYSQSRSSRIYVGVSDLDLESMTILSTRVSHRLTKLNTKQAAYELVFQVVYMAMVGIKALVI